MRLIGIGTKDKLWQPTSQQLALPDWDNSFLEWVDLSGLKLPPMRDADCFHYKATGTTFQNTDYTQFRYPIDLTGVVLPADISSYNHDFVVEIMKRSSNATNPAIKLIFEHVAASYLHSWSDVIYRVIHEIKLSPDKTREVMAESFIGYPHLLTRLAWHMDNYSWRAWPPDTENTSIGLDDEREELASYLGTSKDRWAVREMLRSVTNKELYILQSIPHFVILDRKWGL